MRVLTAGTGRTCVLDLMPARPLSERPVTPHTPFILKGTNLGPVSDCWTNGRMGCKETIVLVQYRHSLTTFPRHLLDDLCPAISQVRSRLASSFFRTMVQVGRRDGVSRCIPCRA